jgi:hypothetical protein
MRGWRTGGGAAWRRNGSSRGALERLRARARRVARIAAAAACLVLAARFLLSAAPARAGAEGGRTVRGARALLDRDADAEALFGIGVFTSYTAAGADRRAAIAATWLPGLQRAAATRRIALRFVVGDPPPGAAPGAAAALAAEVAPARLLHLRGVVDVYAALPAKTAAFVAAAAALWPAAQFVVKADDDVYLRPGALPLLAPAWRARRADYIGCMKSHGIVRDPAARWAEPHAMLLGGDQYHVHAWGSAYALSSRFLALLAALPPGALRLLANEDTSVGAWALALQVRLLDDRRLCAQACGDGLGLAAAVWNFSCTGLCDAPRGMRAAHAQPACGAPAAAPHPGAADDVDAGAFFPFAELNALPEEDERGADTPQA